MPEKIYDQDHYAVLDLSTKTQSLDEKAVKLAYRHALLLHHPDKSSPACPNSKPSVDQITIAYKTLVDPVARSEYDRLRTLKSFTTTNGPRTSHPGLETVDLDDLSYDDVQGIWYRSCRCGKDRAFVVTQEELESNVDCGEIVAGCQGCSLWLQITFALAEDG